MTSIKQLLNKVPEVTIFFWIIKITCTTVGETAADYLNFNLHFGLTSTTLLVSVLLVAALAVQFKVKKYIPWIYWIVVVLISVVGTLITDNLTDNMGVPLQLSTLVFSAALGITFSIWYWMEKTLSIRSINTVKREVFYWLVILFTFALGTAVGDLIAEQYRVGYFNSILLFAGLIAVITTAQFVVKSVLASDHKHQSTNAVFTFWMVYILTRPLGASIGDYLSQSSKYGGLNLGTTNTSILLLGSILILVVYLSVTKRDVTR